MRYQNSPIKTIEDPQETPIFTNYSSNYYVGKLYVTPSQSQSPSQSPTISQRLLKEINAQLQRDKEIKQYDSPLTFKIGTRHITVNGDGNTPTYTITVPESIIDDIDISQPPELTRVFLLKNN